MQTVQITAALSSQVAAVRDANKTPWLAVIGSNVVGVYNSRTAAREAKAEDLHEAKLGKVEEFELVTAQPTAPVGKAIEGDVHHYNCPHCGCDLINGVGDHLQEVNGKHIKHDKYVFECLACGGEFGPAIPEKTTKPAPKATVAIKHQSEIVHPCKRVWNIATVMKELNPLVKRGEVLATCVEEGIAYYTARTQYQQWLSVQKEMAERAAAQSKSK